MALPFGTAMTTDERFLWGDVLTAAEPDPLYPNPQHVMVARPFGQSVVLGMGDGLAIRNVWRLDPATGQIQAPLAHLDALDLDVRQGTGDLVAVDMFSALRLDQAGQVVWQQTMSRPKRVLALPDGSILVAGEATSEVNLDPGPATMLYKPLAQDVLITRLDASGAWIGTAIIAGQGVHHFEDFALAGDGTVFVLGDFDGTVSFGGGHAAKGDRDVFVAALNADFTIRWVTTTGSTGADSGGYVLALPEGGVLVNGLGEIDLPGSKPPPPQVHGPFMFQLDARGEHVWSTYSDLSQRFQLGGDGGLYFFGQISGGVDVTAFRGGTIYSYGNEPLYYASGVVVKMVVR